MAQNNFSIANKFGGYRTKADETNMDADGYLVSGSQNVVSTDGDTVAIRGGYTMKGSAGSGINPIESSYEWYTHRNTEIMLRSYDDELEFYDENADDWARLANSWTAVDFEFAEYWDTTEGLDALLFVNGDDNIYYWSGGQATFASATTNTITLEGAVTWSELGFLVAGTRQVIIEGTTYTYTGGESTTTLTGVTPDPTAAGHAVGATVVQAIRTTATTPASGAKNDIIAVLDNQVYVGSYTDRQVLKSAVDDYTDYTFSSPRIVGEGALFTLDSTLTALVPQEGVMYMSAGKDYWYSTVLALSDDLVNESASVERLKTANGQAAISQSAVGFIKNYVAFISNEPTLDILGRIENIDTEQSKPLSDPIKPDFDDMDFTDAHVKYYKSNLYITVPNESKLYVYNVAKGFWESPWILPARRLAVYNGELYIHSNGTNETYKLFQGYSDYSSADDISLPINAIARFNYMNHGTRASKKGHSEWYTEGYISPNTELSLELFYEYGGSGDTVKKTIDGDITKKIIFRPTDDWSLGKHKLGDGKLGGDGDEDASSKFRIIHEMPLTYYFEIQPQYSSYAVDNYWEVLAYGSNAQAANDDRSEIKQ